MHPRSVSTTVLLVLAVAASASARWQADDPADAPRITYDEFAALHGSGAVLVVDVREPQFFEMGHIPGAVSIPLATIRERAAGLAGDGRPIVTYCACVADETSARAALVLRSEGIRDVSVLEGGLLAWVRFGNPLEGHVAQD